MSSLFATATSIITCSFILTSQTGKLPTLENACLSCIFLFISSSWPSPHHIDIILLILHNENDGKSGHMLCQAVLLISNYSFLIPFTFLLEDCLSPFRLLQTKSLGVHNL